MHLLLLDEVHDRLNRLEATFDDLQPTWKVTSAEDARDADELLEHSAWNAIVVSNSRVQRSVIDLLARAKKSRPSALRIAVVGDEREAALFAKADVAHRVILAPIDGKKLASSLKSMKTLEAMLQSDTLRDEISKIQQLPRAPDVGLALMRENAEGKADMTRIAERLHGDAGLSAKVLQLSNSTFYSRGSPIMDIERALTRLGMDAVVNLVMAAQTFTNPDLQNRAIMASQLATQVLRDVKHADLCVVASTAATLAYTGKLLNLSGKNIQPKLLCDPDDLFDEELPPIDCIAGAYLLSRWGLPWPVIEAVAYHRQPMSGSELGFGVTTAVHVACALANGEALDESWLEFLDASELVRSWEEKAKAMGAPPRPE